MIKKEITIILILATLFLISCNKYQKYGQTYTIQQLSYFGTWEDVIHVYGFGFNYDVSQEIIEGLEYTSNKAGDLPRTYRIVDFK